MTAYTPGGGSEAVDPSQPGIFIFTDKHYSQVYSPAAQPRVASALSFSPTNEEKLAQYDSIIVNTGRYDVTGSTMMLRPLMARSPEFVGGESAVTFEIDGDVLTLTTETLKAANGQSASDASGAVMKLRRIE